MEKLFFRLNKISHRKRFLPNHSLNKHLFGNLEFFSILGVICGGLYYVSIYKDKFSETVRLISTGIATHLIVDVFTYFGDKINTEVKVASFKTKNLSKDYISQYFKNEIQLNKNKFNKRKVKKSLLGHYISSFKGIQPGVLYLTLNSLFFYSLYKNIKSELKKYHIEGFINFFIAAGISQLIAMTFSFPLENIKTRMQASSFTYDSIMVYYKKVFLKGNMISKIKLEYSGFFGHLFLYVIFEAFSFSIYESGIHYMHNKKIFSNVLTPNEPSFFQILISSFLSGIISAIITNPIDVYQINKQMDPSFSIAKLNLKNIFVGLKERTIFVLGVNIFTFFLLEKIGKKYYDVSIE